MRVLLVLGLLCASVLARRGFGPTEQEWGYVTVRNGAHMFWWLQQTSAQVDRYTDRPLVIWLQGGPGASSTGFGNFGELGPLTADLEERSTTWIKEVNVLFVDNPVGTGFSYVDTASAFTTTNRQIAEDFVVLLQGFYKEVPELLESPLYIFSESYGGKMTAEIALVLDEAIKRGDLDVNLIGVGLGDSWISPIDSVLTWAPYLLNVGAIDQQGYEKVKKSAELTKSIFDSGDYEAATYRWGQTEEVILNVTSGIDFYNILTEIERKGLKKTGMYKLIRPASDDEDTKIEIIMNKQVKEALGLNVTWGRQSNAVFSRLSADFMKPVTDIIEQLLNETDIKVAVFNGQLDLIVDTPGTVAWVDKLRFEGSSTWSQITRRPIVVDHVIEGYVKKLGNFAMYWVNRAGHMVPSDNPAAMDYILRDISNNFGTP